ncbi:hypothetical protein HYX05_01960 [Candidatus Woesearchaeota archaeon]|nr:hypothetical protein [Candidatus Woesearchaeota archaeon]
MKKVKTRQITKKTNKEKYVKFCPKYNSIDVEQDKSTLQQVGYLPVFYICKYCNYSGYTFPEIEISGINKLKTEKKSVDEKSELMDMHYGKFMVSIWWKIIGPMFLSVGLILLYFYFNSANIDYFIFFISIAFVIGGLAMTFISYLKRK